MPENWFPSHLMAPLRQALLDCGPFSEDRQLKAVFRHPSLGPWRDQLPQADSVQDRVDLTIDFLLERNTSDGENVLIVFLRVLGERINPSDACYSRITELAQQAEAAFGTTSTSSQPPDWTRTRGRGLQAPGPSSSPLGPIRNRWALLVGVNRYVDSGFAPLSFCVNDVLTLEETLKASGYTVVALHDEAVEGRLQPDNENIEAELARLCQVAQPEDLLWVHFACHGQVHQGEPMLITRRTRRTTVAKSGLPLREVERRMRESAVRRLILTLDACHVGVDIGRSGSDPEFIRHAHELAEGFAMIAASTAQQKAQEWQEKQHGVFTYYLLNGITGQAARNDNQFVTVDDLKTYVLDNLRRWSVENDGLIQEPSARTEGLGDMILVDYRTD
jgi:hypothetical protein